MIGRTDGRTNGRTQCVGPARQSHRTTKRFVIGSDECGGGGGGGGSGIGGFSFDVGGRGSGSTQDKEYDDSTILIGQIKGNI